MGQATLMYGIGATKAGTSWLYRYLDAHPECAMSYPKELHYFDAREAGPKNWQSAELRKHIRRTRKAAEGRSGEARWASLARLARLQEWEAVLSAKDDNPQAYLAYLQHDAGEARLVGDITPAYAMLPEARLTEMQSLAPVTKFVYLLRDPVERLWSNIRMSASRQLSGKAEGVAALAHKLIRDGLKPDALKRSDYAGNLARIDQSVPRASLFVEFYERLFSPEAIARLCAFLGLSEHAANFDRRVHQGTPVALEADARTHLQELMAPQYAAVEARFGTLPAAWQQNMIRV